MFDYIYHPETLDRFNLTSKKGKEILKRYLQQYNLSNDSMRGGSNDSMKLSNDSMRGGFEEDYEYNFTRCSRYHKMPEECLNDGCHYENNLCLNSPDPIEYHKRKHHRN